MRVGKKINLSTFSCTIQIIITDNLPGEVDQVYKKYKMDDKFVDVAEGVVVSIVSDRYYLILATQYLTHNTIAHEVYHAAVKVAEDRDIKDEEAQAWLVGHITAEVYKFIEKKKLIITHGR